MPRYIDEPPFQHGQAGRTGVLLINLGTPTAPTAQALRPYLKQFLSDPRVVEIPRLVWWIILNVFILNLRPGKSAHKYAQIWTKDGSPLRTYTERLAKLVQGQLGPRWTPSVIVRHAMRYGDPAVADVLQSMKAAGCERILLMPLYPQYAASSTASALDAAFAALLTMRNLPEIRCIKHFHDDPRYIGWLASQVQRHWQAHGRGDKLLMSFHGVPQFSLDKGDPYHCECLKTARLLTEALGLQSGEVEVCFQSRFGKAKWLQPYTTEVLTRLGREKVRRLDVICPGFVADCLETLEEIAMEGKTIFLNAGGGDFRYIACPNDAPEWAAVIADIAASHMQGWGQADLPAEETAAGLARSRALALARGAPH